MPQQLNIKLLPGRDDDLLAWYQGLQSLPPSKRAEAVRATLRRGLATAGQAPTPGGTAEMDWGRLRQVMDAAVQAGVAALIQQGVAPATAQQRGDETAAAILDSFDDLVME